MQLAKNNLSQQTFLSNALTSGIYVLNEGVTIAHFEKTKDINNAALSVLARDSQGKPSLLFKDVSDGWQGRLVADGGFTKFMNLRLEG